MESLEQICCEKVLHFMVFFRKIVPKDKFFWNTQTNLSRVVRKFFFENQSLFYLPGRALTCQWYMGFFLLDDPPFQAPLPLQRLNFLHLQFLSPHPSLTTPPFSKKFHIWFPSDFSKISAPNTLILTKIHSQDPSSLRTIRTVDPAFENPCSTYPPKKKKKLSAPWVFSYM